MDRSKIKTLYHTVKYLKPIQIYYRVYYFARNRFFKKSYYKELSKKNISQLIWEDAIFSFESYLDSNKFHFLNISKDFENNIDWNFSEFGKLWTFNLNYFDFLNQKQIEVNEGLKLIKDFVAKDNLLKDGKESYPISLRGINWVKFLAKNKISADEINQNLYNHYQLLLHNIEYHLLGNHLLENGFSFLFGAYYFQDEVLYKKGVQILKKELKEQILNDGAHFELSPMYHQTMLFRVLDCIQLIQLNNWKDDNLLDFLNNIALKMLSWLEQVTFNNGDIPMVNDSSFGIAPDSDELLNYAKKLGLQYEKIKLSDSGYRMFKKDKFELFVDVGNVGASYQPAHVHSDTFNFIFYAFGKPVFVDTGLSTYEKNQTRQTERSTASHNTVQIEDIEQTQVWGGFRVGKRAKITNLNEKNNSIEATHNGYKDLNLTHSRKFTINERSVFIKDIISKEISSKQVAYFHLHPRISNVLIENSKVTIEESKIELFFEGKNISIERGNFRFANGFNKTSEAIKLKIIFESSLSTTINL
ncbi:alginate lyase family protein [Polaribacter haliotis]|uniref:Alginate lyase family protein n=1 Tax=Polaribacter haliotis TaxID=1888915 RepID=A0A7L8AJU6_9FLAO|nr:alginate lyase family protein [Polaribacter haliotis]QOD62069.1 alginate lyase family protein [Polaribacter haliotis]